jgi:integrase
VENRFKSLHFILAFTGIRMEYGNMAAKKTTTHPGVFQLRDEAGHPIPGKWRCQVPAKLSPTGRKTMYAFATKAEAVRYRKSLEEAKREFGRSGQNLTPAQQETAGRLFELAEKAGFSLGAMEEALRVGMARMKEVQRFPTLAEAAEEFLAGKESGRLNPHRKKLTPRYLRELRITISEMVAGFGGAMVVSDLDRKPLLRHIEDHSAGESSFNARLAHLRIFTGWAVKEGWLQSQPLDSTDKHLPKAAKDTVEPDQLRAMFDACRPLYDEPNLPDRYECDASQAEEAIALQAFGGLRASEVRKLTWDHISLETGELMISEDIAKTSAMRIVEINPSLRAWLERVPVEKRQGPVAPFTWNRTMSAIRHMAGVADLRNPLRTSFAVYSRASGVPLERIGQQLGHTGSEVTHKSYANKLVSSGLAARYWAVMPEEGEPSTSLKIAN